MLQISNEADFRYPLSASTHGTGGEGSSSLLVCRPVFIFCLFAVEKPCMLTFRVFICGVSRKTLQEEWIRVELLSLLNVVSSGTT